MKEPLLLPRPRRMRILEGRCILQDKKLILASGMSHPEALAAGERVQRAVKTHARRTWSITRAAPRGDAVGISLRMTPNPAVPGQGYRLRITPGAITLASRDTAGMFYGTCTLRQLLVRFARTLPCMEITDHPDFPARGVLLDISRSKVPATATLFGLVDKLAGWKINHLQLYMEHTFAYAAHQDVWSGASPMTGEEIMKLDAYCRDRCMDLVPCQQSFGHMERWLQYPGYADMADTPGENTLCPTDRRCIRFLEGLYDELLPHFQSRLFNVCCDETRLGHGRSRAACGRKGAATVYLDFLTKIHRLVKARGRTMMCWADIMMRRPNLVRRLPPDVVLLAWGYHADHPFRSDCAHLAEAGLPFYVCPGTSSWNSIAGRTANCEANLRNAAQNGLQYGARGFLNTDWGDNGHWQYLPVSYTGFAYGAALSWCVKTNQDIPLSRTVSLHGFQDGTGHMGAMAGDLGNVDRPTGMDVPNASVLFRLLHTPLDNASLLAEMRRGALNRVRGRIDRAMAHLDKAGSTGQETDLIRREFQNAAALLRHACARGAVMEKIFRGDARRGIRADLRALAKDMQRIVGEHRRLWLARNRPGGLEESVARMDARIQEYIHAAR